MKDANAVKYINNKDGKLSRNTMKIDKDEIISELREILKKSAKKEETSVKQIANDNNRFVEASKPKQTEISKMKIEKDKISSTLLQLSEEKNNLTLKYKD